VTKRRLEMRVVLSEERVRVAADTENAIDTTELSEEEFRNLIERLSNEQQWDILEPLMDERPVEESPASSVGVGSAAPADDGSDDDEDEAWAQGGTVEMKTIYDDDSEYHGMPGLEGTADGWLASLHQYLRDEGIDPVGPVTEIQLWLPKLPEATHYEVGAVVDGSYAKFDLTGGGYRMIFNATAPTVGDYYANVRTYETQWVTAGDLYGSFLQIAQENGPYNGETNDCERFATDLYERLGG
jgi:hypothetical protein